MAKKEDTHTDAQRRAALKRHSTISFTRDADGMLTITNIPAEISDALVAQTFDRFSSQRYRNWVLNHGKGNTDLASAAKKQEIALLAVSAAFLPAIRESVEKSAAKADKKKRTTKSDTTAATIDA